MMDSVREHIYNNIIINQSYFYFRLKVHIVQNIKIEWNTYKITSEIHRTTNVLNRKMYQYLHRLVVCSSELYIWLINYFIIRGINPAYKIVKQHWKY